MKSIKALKELADYLCEQEPAFKKEGLNSQSFDGYFVHWDKIIELCYQAWDYKKPYGCSPGELITDIIEERDEAIKKNKAHKKEIFALNDKCVKIRRALTDHIAQLQSERDSWKAETARLAAAKENAK